jgi:hypothetical protein
VLVLEPADDEKERFAHGGNISRDVDRVGDDQEGDDAEHQPAWIMPLEVGNNPDAGDAADMGADELDGDHERRCQEHRPEQAVAELRAGLRVGSDAGRIVIRRARDEPWPEQAQDDVGLGDVGGPFRHHRHPLR